MFKTTSWLSYDKTVAGSCSPVAVTQNNNNYIFADSFISDFSFLCTLYVGIPKSNTDQCWIAVTDDNMSNLHVKHELI